MISIAAADEDKTLNAWVGNLRAQKTFILHVFVLHYDLRNSFHLFNMIVFFRAHLPTKSDTAGHAASFTQKKV